MIAILLCGPEKRGDMINVLLSSLRASGASVLYITSKTVSLLPTDAEHADFLLIDSVNIQDIHLDRGIAVFTGAASDYAEINLPESFFAVVEPENEKAIDVIKKKSLQPVTCGLSQRDTLTFSSLSAEGAVVSLQREIRSIGSGSILPREIPVKLRSPCSDYQLLAAVAVLLLSGRQIEESGLEF